MESVSENNPHINPRPGTPMPIRILVPALKNLAKLQKILKQQPYFNQLDISSSSQVQAMEQKQHPLEGPTAPVPHEQTLDSEEQNLTTQSGPDSETDSSFVCLPFKKLERRAFSNPK